MWYSGNAQTMVNGLSPDPVEHRLEPGLALQDVGGHVAVQQDGALGHAGGAAGVLQESDVVGTHVHPTQRHAHAGVQRVVEARHGAALVQRQPVLGHHLAQVAHREVDETALPEAQQIAHRRQHDMAHRRVVDDLLEGGREVLQHDGHRGAGIAELVLQFARRVQRVHVDDREACAQDGRQGHQVLRHVGHHDRHARAALQPERLQPGTQRFGELVDVAVGQARVHAHRRVARGVTLESVFQHRRQCRQRVGTNGRRHAGRVMGCPGSLHGAAIGFASASECGGGKPRIVAGLPAPGLR
jgi:hypothetical protein